MSSRPLRLPLAAADRLARAKRIRQIGREVASGRYLIPADRVADAVLDFYRRDDGS